jgi:pyruvate/2-oxoglutarate dehydrogenase complex dihydrolipoamide dehydrogenase (E3) component
MIARQFDLCVIGAGSAGLSVAATAALLGVRTVLIERVRMGGECLNTGCVPSKSLLASAKAAHTVRVARAFGVGAEPSIDFKRTHAYVHSGIKAIAPHDGKLKLVATRGGKVLGASILGAHAGELTHLWVVVIERGRAARHSGR